MHTNHHSLQGSQYSILNIYSIESTIYIHTNLIIYFYLHIYNKLLRTLTSNTLTQYNHSIYGTLQSNKPYNIYTMIRDLLVYSLDYYFITDSYMLTRNEWDIDIPHIPSQN
jgi:hypothetical protein